MIEEKDPRKDPGTTPENEASENAKAPVEPGEDQSSELSGVAADGSAEGSDLASDAGSSDAEADDKASDEALESTASEPTAEDADSSDDDDPSAGGDYEVSRAEESSAEDESSKAPDDEASNDEASDGAPDVAPSAAGSSGGDEPPAADAASDDEDGSDGGLKEMSFIEHLQELRVRVVRMLIGVFVGFLLCYGFSKQMFQVLMQPLVDALPPDSSMIFTALPEAFFTYIKVALVAGVFVASPYIFYQIWAFVAPGLYKEERKYLVPIAIFSAFFFLLGAFFGYFVVFPFGFQFFMGFADEHIKAMPSLKEYLGFSLKLLFAFGLIFELPLFIFFLSRLGLVTAASLRKFRKYAVMLAFVVSAILTPPDVISQLLMAGPLLILYEMSIFVAVIFGKKKKPKPAEEDEEDDEKDAS